MRAGKNSNQFYGSHLSVKFVCKPYMYWVILALVFFLGHTCMLFTQGSVDHKSLEVCTGSYLVLLARMSMMKDVKL